jgi:hypothetical protein
MLLLIMDHIICLRFHSAFQQNDSLILAMNIYYDINLQEHHSHLVCGFLIALGLVNIPVFLHY